MQSSSNKNTFPGLTAGTAAAFVCTLLLTVFAVLYFSAYTNPYMKKNMANISDGWRYGVGTEDTDKQMNLLHQVTVPPNETLHLFRVLNEQFPDAALMLKSNHQWLRVSLDEELLFENPRDPNMKNPGMGLHFITLPNDYEGKLLHIEITSPYEAYSGAPGSVYIGDIPSLQTYTLFYRSLPHKLLMAYCVAAGAFMMVLAFLRRKQNAAWWGTFSFGVFSVLWGFYFPSGDYIAHQFLSPGWVSRISIGLYFLYPLPLMLFFYSQFSRRRKVFLPAVILMGVFVAASLGLQMSGLMDFPEMLNVFNPFYIMSTVYMIVLGWTEIKKGGFIKFTVPWITLVFLISIQSMISFYTTRVKQDETLYEMAFFSFIMVVWIYNVVTFLRTRAKEKHDLLELNFKNAALGRLNIAKTEFLQDMSHEMKAPLTVIATGIDFADSELSAEDGSFSEAIGTLEMLRAETQRLGRMVGGMAELASMNELSENRKRVEFAKFLKDSAEAFQFAIERDNNTLTVQIAPGIPDAFVETDRFTQVIANLLTNAAEHTKNGQISVTADFDDEYITVRVTDTGEGISPEVLPNVFERGVSGKGSTGYGLYICKTIIEAHGGLIKADSEPGKGTTVTFTVPVYGGQEAGHNL
ncbi:MAG: sensor histidine kinase [Oscillospiraceae bacterium]|nr:sensor histidine kinase [Oscillospiraceae bacterium]